MLDSVGVIEQNSRLDFDPRSLDRWRVAAISSQTGPLGRWISNLSFALDNQLFEDPQPAQMKFVNALLHVGIALVIWRFLLLVLQQSPVLEIDAKRARWIALLATALWVLHPLHVSTVMYTVQRMSQLATLFIALGLWAYTRERVKWLQKAPGAVDISRALQWLALFTVLAAISKEIGLLLPLYVAAVEVWLFQGRVQGGRSALVYRVGVATLVGPAILILGLLLVAPTWLVDWYSIRAFSLEERLMTQLRLLWQYVGWLMLWDFRGMGLFHDDIGISRSLIEPFTTLVALIAWSTALALAWLSRFRLPILGVGIAWFLAGHVMESSVVPLEMAFEHRNYLPSLGPLLVVAWAVTAVPENRYFYAGLAGVFLSLLLGFLLFVRTSFWESELTLAETHYRYHPQSLRSRFHLASVYYGLAQSLETGGERGRYLVAARSLHESNIEQNPVYAASLVSLIFLDGLAGRTDAVQGWYDQLAQSIDRDNVGATEYGSLRGLVECVDRGDCLPPAGELKPYLLTYAERQPSVYAHGLLVWHCLAQSDEECVTEHAEAILALDSGHSDSYRALFTISLAGGNAAGALDSLERLLAADHSRRHLHLVKDTLEKGR